MTTEEHLHMQRLEATIKRYRGRIVELKQLARQPCYVSDVSSRMCERGTKSCIVEHDPAREGAKD